MATVKVDVNLDEFDNHELISELEYRTLSTSEVDDLAAIVEDHRALDIDVDNDVINPTNLWHSQIMEEIDTLLKKCKNNWTPYN
jgi:hypothetical protein